MSPITPESVSGASTGPAKARVLLAEESLPYRRVIREALTAFRDCEVDDAPSGEVAFELALRRPYALFLLALHLPDLTGDMLDRLLAKAYPRVHAQSHTAPPVIYLLRPGEDGRFRELQRDARVRGSIPLPPKLDALLTLAGALLPERPPFVP